MHTPTQTTHTPSYDIIHLFCAQRTQQKECAATSVETDFRDPGDAANRNHLDVYQNRTNPHATHSFCYLTYGFYEWLDHPADVFFFSINGGSPPAGGLFDGTFRTNMMI